MIWFDGNRIATRKAYLKRGDDEYYFDLQLSNIDKMDLDSYRAVKINTFDEKGEFLSQDKIADLILK